MTHYSATVTDDRLLQLPAIARQRLLPGQIIEVEIPDAVGADDPTLAWLEARIAAAPTDADEIREAEEDMRELMRNMNANRKVTGERIPFPDIP